MAVAKLFLLTLLPATLLIYAGALKETKMTIYFHDFLTGQGATVVAVAGIPGNRWSFGDFGSVYVNDDIVREGFSIDSPMVGRSQGIYVVSALDGSNAFWSNSLVFTNKAYGGSTLEIQGRFSQTGNFTEVSITSGTGKFRFAKGYAIFEQLFYNTSYVVARCDITLRLDSTHNHM